MTAVRYLLGAGLILTGIIMIVYTVMSIKDAIDIWRIDGHEIFWIVVVLGGLMMGVTVIAMGLGIIILP